MRGFTLIELLVVISIIAILVGLSFPAFSQIRANAKNTATLSNMQQVGIGMIAFANDHDNGLPARVETATPGNDKWPKALQDYLGNNTRVYVAPDDPVATKSSPEDLVSNDRNNSSFVFNGFNDLGGHSNPNLTVSLLSIQERSNTILMTQKVSQRGDFYMDFADGDQKSVININQYNQGNNYVFADGSARRILSKDYNDTMWLVNKSYQIP